MRVLSTVERENGNAARVLTSSGSATATPFDAHRGRGLAWRRAFVPYSFLLPFLIIFAAFTLYPFLSGFYLSFTNSSPLQRVTQFVGLDNYRTIILRDQQFHDSLRNTAIYALLLVPAQTIGGLLLALYVNQKLWAHQLSRLAFFAPFVLSVSVVGIVWGWILDTRYGLLNLLLGAIGLPGTIPWLTNVNWVMLGLSLASLWWRVGFSMILFLAGLQDIPADLREAAQVDGAGSRQVFLHVTLPLLRPVAVLVLTLAFLEAVKAFGLMFFLTNGGPAGVSTTVVYNLFLKFQTLHMGYASAIGFLLLLMTMAIALVRQFALREQVI
jgi:multiple sugar transport system permease protein